MRGRSPADVLADLAALAARQAELTAELASALRAAPAPAPLPAPASAPEYLTTREAAALLGVSVRTLAALRAAGKGPRFVRLGHAVRYPRDTVQSPSSEAPALPSNSSAP
ncbi:MAG TPA: helix-turn-helix domain-containing protein [Polyangiaceae bacterium]